MAGRSVQFCRADWRCRDACGNDANAVFQGLARFHDHRAFLHRIGASLADAVGPNEECPTRTIRDRLNALPDGFRFNVLLGRTLVRLGPPTKSDWPDRPWAIHRLQLGGGCPRGHTYAVRVATHR